MSWTEYRRRGETLRAVIDHADTTRDGVLPMDLPGVPHNFRDELDLVAALLLRWHSQLSGNLERAMSSQPMSPEDAVVGAWAQTARELPGVRAMVDRALEQPASPEMAEALARARRREWADLALAAGLASSPDDALAAVAGQRIEEQARAALPSTGARRAVPEQEAGEEASRRDFVQRLRAALVA